MPGNALQKRWRLVRYDVPFAKYAGTTSRERADCLRDVITKLRAGTLESVFSDLRGNLYYIFACNVTISAAVSGDEVVLLEVTEESDE